MLIGRMNDTNKEQRLTKNESARIWQMKAWAILFVVCAHCAGVPVDAPAASQIVSQLLQSFGSLGVPIFFFLAGYVFRHKKLIPWLRGKITGLLIPWLVCGLLVYLYVHLRKGGISAASLALWLVGDGSYLWYLSVMVLLWLWARVMLWGAQKGFWTPLVAEVVSILLSVTALVLEYLDILSFHPYLNIFRWMWLFVLGLFAGRISLLEKAGHRMFWIPIWTFLLAALAVLKVHIDYWSVGFCLCACVSIAVSVNGYVPSGKIATYLQTLGKDSFAVYLLHMPAAGLVANLCNRVSDHSGLLTLIRPFVALFITHGCIILLKKAGKCLNCEKMFYVLFGFR